MKEMFLACESPTLTILILMGWQHSIEFTVAWKISEKSSYSEKVQISGNIVKLIAYWKENWFDKYATRGVSAFTITSIYLIKFIVGQNCHSSC